MLGQTYLDGLGLNLDGLEKIVDRPLINEDDMTDLGARVNALSGRISAVNEKLKAKIKSELISQDKTIWQGKFYEAVITRCDVTRLLTDKVKSFLGKRLEDFSVTNAEVRLSFRPRG